MLCEDFWFIDKRVQTKNLKRWFLWGALLFIFVGVSVFFCIKSMYRTFNDYYINTDEMVITVDESKKTNANGYMKGTITNNKEVESKDKYMKFAFYTKNKINIGNEYIELGTMQSNETKTYSLDYRYSNVKFVIITIVDNKE